MKKLLTFLTLLTLFFTTAWAATTVTLTQSALGLTGSYTTNTEKLLDGITYVYTDLMKNNDNIQAKASSGEIHNSTAFSGNIISVAITHFGTARATTIHGSSDGANWNQVATGNGSITGDFRGKGYKYFKITRGDNAAYWTKIEITYDDGSASTTHSLTLPTGLTGGTVTATGASDLTAIPSGTNMTVTATPSPGYTLEWMKANGTEITNPYTFSITANTTITASFVQEQASTTQWVLTSPSDLASGDVVLIVDKQSSRAMSNDNGTSAAPSATSVTLNSNKDKVSAGVTADLQWEVSKTAGSFYFALPGSGLNLYCTNTNNGVRVGTGEANAFKIQENYLYNTGTKRYLGVYNNQDWRCYTSTGGNIANTQVAFYKKVETGAHSVTVGTITGEGTITPSSGSANTGDEITVAAEPATGYELTALAYNGTAIDITSTPYTFTMPDADVTLTATFTAINYNIYRTITAQNPDDQGGWIGDWNENCNLPDGAQGTDYTVTSTYNKEVQFKAGNYEGYKILAENVTAKDANNNNVPLTVVSSDNSGIVFKFNMPASNVTISAYFTFYQPDLYLMGNAHDQNWQTTYKMDYNSSNTGREYSIRTYFAADHGEFQFEADGTRYASGAVGAYWLIGENGDYEYSTEVPLYANSDKNYRVVPGIYDIYVNKDRNKVVVTPVAVELTFSPAAGSVYQGTTVTATSNLYTLLHAINSSITESSVTNEVSLDGTTFSSSVALDNTGSATVTGKATYGYITPTATADYNVTEFPTEGQYELVTSKDDLINGGEYVILNHASPSIEGHAMSTTQNSNNRGETALIPIINNKIIPTEDTQIVTLETASNGWYLKVGDNSYLYAVSGNNYLKTGSDNTSDDYVAKISIGESSYVATIEFQTETKRYLKRNNSSNIFSCYTSGQQDVYLYKKATNVSRVETPTFDPEAGTYNETQNVTIACATDGATIYYTLDGSEPTSNSNVYSQAIPVSSTTTINAIAMKDGMNPSNMATATYTIKVATPTFTPEAGTYGEVQDVTINCATSGASIYYTTDNTDPTTGSTLYDGTAISVTETTTIKAIAVKDGLYDSEIATATYTIVLPCKIPFVETWNKNTHGTGANSPDDSEPAWSGTIASSKTSYDDNAGWTYEELGVGYQCVKLGSSRNAGSATTPEIIVHNNTVHKMTFRAGGWGNDDTHMNLSATGATIFSDEGCTQEVTGYDLVNSAWTNYTVYIKTSATSMKITWASSIANDRFFLDEVNIDYLSKPATLAEIISLGDEADGKLYKISNEEGLLGVYKNGTSVWFKDKEQAVDYQNPTASSYEYYTVVEQKLGYNISEKDFAQNNWIEVVFPSEQDFTKKYVRNLTGIYSCENGNPKLTLTVAVDEVNDVTEVQVGGLAYELNPYMAVNFSDKDQTYTNSQGVTSTFFFSQPKAQEYAQILWAVWNGTEFIMPTGEDNYYGFEGSFTVNDKFNSHGSLSNLKDGEMYNFKAIIRKSTSKAGPYEVYPTDLNPNEVITAINVINVNGKVKSVKYVNVAGMVSDVPFQGVNIVVTEYTDGSRTTSKMLRK